MTLRFVRVDSEGNTVGPADCGWLDGYAVGDRLLENVMFKITIDSKGKFHAVVNDGDREYFATLNQRRWLRKVAEFAKDYDVFGCSPDCRDDDVVLEDVD